MNKKLTFSQWFTLRMVEYIAVVFLLILFGGEGTFTDALKAGVIVFIIIRLLVFFKVLK